VLYLNWSFMTWKSAARIELRGDGALKPFIACTLNPTSIYNPITPYHLYAKHNVQGPHLGSSPRRDAFDGHHGARQSAT
jgi:hypothetical protein